MDRPNAWSTLSSMTSGRSTGSDDTVLLLESSNISCIRMFGGQLPYASIGKWTWLQLASGTRYRQPSAVSVIHFVRLARGLLKLSVLRQITGNCQNPSTQIIYLSMQYNMYDE